MRHSTGHERPSPTHVTTIYVPRDDDDDASPHEDVTDAVAAELASIGESIDKLGELAGAFEIVGNSAVAKTLTDQIQKLEQAKERLFKSTEWYQWVMENLPHDELLNAHSDG
jgi:hypothetical protein